MKEKYDLVKLSDICEINIGKTPSRNKIEYWNGNHFWLSIGDMGKSKYIINTKEKITDEGAKLFNGKLVKPNTLLFSFKLSIGKVGIAEVPLYTNEAIASLPIKDKSKVDSIYLFYALQNLDLTGKTDRAVMGSTLNKRKLEQIKIPLPDIESQRRIAEILDKADEIIRKRRGAIALTEQLQKSIFLDMFGDPVTNPKGWEVRKLGSICTIVRGGSPRPINDYLGGTIPWIKIGDATEGDDIYIHKTAEMIREEGMKKSRYLEPNTLIFANCGVSLGFARILKISGCIHDGWLAFFNLHPCINQIFLLKSLNQITQYFRSIAPDGTQPNLNTTIMNNFNIPVPPIDLQEKFESIIKQVLNNKIKLKQSLEESENLFNSLLQRAFKGEL